MSACSHHPHTSATIVSPYCNFFSSAAPFLFFFFFNDTATTEIYTLSLHDALPISLVGLLWVDQTSLTEAGKAVARWALFAAPLLVSAGFFFSVVPPQADRPNGLISLVYIGAASLAAGVVLLGKGLLLAPK